VKLDPGAHVFLHSGFPLNPGVTVYRCTSTDSGSIEIGHAPFHPLGSLCGMQLLDGACIPVLC
jgi:hypothetical protein